MGNMLTGVVSPDVSNFEQIAGAWTDWVLLRCAGASGHCLDVVCMLRKIELGQFFQKRALRGALNKRRAAVCDGDEFFGVCETLGFVSSWSLVSEPFKAVKGGGR
jgi:hypothetical protein